MRQDLATRIHKSGIHRLRLQRKLQKLASDLGLDPAVVEADAASRNYLCPICHEPFLTPRAQLIEEEVHSIICALCATAIERCEGDLLRLARHYRFNKSRRATRVRLARLIEVRSGPPLLRAAVVDEPRA